MYLFSEEPIFPKEIYHVSDSGFLGMYNSLIGRSYKFYERLLLIHPYPAAAPAAITARAAGPVSV